MSTEDTQNQNGSTDLAVKQPESVDRVGDRDICRDYLNKVCSRGTRCKFYHPPGQGEQQRTEKTNDDFNFCIDYQNQGCFRGSCRFVHAPQEEVDRYKRNGDVSVPLARAIAAVTKSDNIQGIPFCKEFQGGRCMRGQRCRYWHVNVEIERERRAAMQSALPGGPGVVVGGGAGFDPVSHGIRPQPLLNQGNGAPRRRHAGDDFDPATKRPNYGPPGAAPPPHFPAGGAPPPHYLELERENAEYKREIDQLRRELQREKDRYDALLSAISHQPTANAPAAVPSPHYQAQGVQPNAPAYHDPYGNTAAAPRYQQHNVPKQNEWYTGR